MGTYQNLNLINIGRQPTAPPVRLIPSSTTAPKKSYKDILQEYTQNANNVGSKMTTNNLNTNGTTAPVSSKNVVIPNISMQTFDTQSFWTTARIDVGITPKEKEILKGDVNEDGKVDGNDVELLLKHLLGYKVKINIAAGEFGNDNKIGIDDIAELMNIVSKLKGADNGINGDMNNDGVVNSDDATMLANFLNDKESRYNLYNKLDVNGDKKVDDNDVEAIKNISLYGKVQKPTGITGDLNNDGKITTADLLMLSRYLAGKENADNVYNNIDIDENGALDKADVEALQNLIAYGRIRKPTGVTGDINNDGKIDIVDVGFIKQYLNGLKDIREIYNGDVNNDGVIDEKDANHVLNLYFSGTLEKPTDINGDTNNDGIINEADIEHLKSFLEGKIEAIRTYNADTNKDGQVDIKDLRQLNNMVNGTIAGDANNDGKVDTKDYAVMRDYILGYRGDIPNANAADIDLDGNITNDDIIRLVNMPELQNLQYRPGDVNYDGVVDQADVDDLTNYLNKRPSNFSIFNHADMNNDGNLDFNDVAKIQEMIAPPPPPPPQFPDYALQTVPAYANPEKTIQVNPYERVDSGDRITVLEVDEANHSLKVEYPTSKGNKIRWVDASIFDSPNNPLILNVPLYHQYDSRWSNVKIGTKNIGQVGCLITSLAMKYQYSSGIQTDPETMRYKLNFDNNSLYWNSLNQFGFSYTTKYGSHLNDTMMRFIIDRIKEGKPVIIGGQSNSSGSNQHWVVITGYNGDLNNLSAANFIVNDPGKAGATNLQQFLNNKHSIIKGLIY